MHPHTCLAAPVRVAGTKVLEGKHRDETTDLTHRRAEAAVMPAATWGLAQQERGAVMLPVATWDRGLLETVSKVTAEPKALTGAEEAEEACTPLPSTAAPTLEETTRGGGRRAVITVAPSAHLCLAAS